MSTDTQIAEKALAGAIEVQTDTGRILLHGHDKVITPIIAEHGTWEPHLSAAIAAELKPGMRVADVGANVGYFVRAMAQVVGPTGHVTAIEPDPGNLALLRQNVETAAAPVTIIAAAAWFEPGIINLTRCADNTGDHRIDVRADERDVVAVEAVVLDEVFPDALDVLLLDTQGVEHVILRGASALLQSARRPVVFAEFWPDGLEEAGYVPLDVLREYRDLGLSISIVEETDAELGADAPVEDILAAILSITPERYGTLRLQPPKPTRRAPWWRRRSR